MKMVELMREEGNLISYLQNTSHQMRTPMTLIRSYTELILAELYGPLEPEIKERMETISSNLEEMTYFVDQVQDIGYISNGKTRANIREYDLTGLIEKIAIDISLIGMTRDVKFKLENLEEPFNIHIDQHLTRRAVSHLLRYVISTAPHGSEVKLALKPGKERVLFIVFGFGQVMDKDQMAEIVRSMSETEARFTTMEWEKLSLPITKAMMEMQNGDLTIFEDENNRTVYVLEFPVQ